MNLIKIVLKKKCLYLKYIVQENNLIKRKIVFNFLFRDNSNEELKEN